APPAGELGGSATGGGRMADVFGSLKWSPDLEWWSGAAELAPGHRIELHVEAANDPAELRAAVARVEPAWERLLVAEPSVRAAVAGQMTEAHNRYCNPEDE